MPKCETYIIVERYTAKKMALCALFDTGMKLSTQIVLLVTLNFGY